MKNQDTIVQMTAYDIAFKCITSSIEALRFTFGLPLSVILKALTDATANINSEIDPGTRVDLALQMVRNRKKRVADTRRLLKADAGKLVQ